MNQDIDDFQNDIPNEQPQLIEANAIGISLSSCCGCCCLYILLLITLMIMSIILYTHFTNSPDEYFVAAGVAIYAYQNLETSPIQNLVAIDANKACPHNTTKISLGEWSGTEGGCYCPITGSVSEGSCNLIELIVCRNVQPVEPVRMTQWQGTSFCATRIKSYYITTGSCPPNYQSCGLNLCISNEETCPTTNVTIIKNDNKTYSGEEIDNEIYNNSIQMPNGDTLMFGIQNDISPLYDLEISANGLPCLSIDAETKSLNGTEYPLQNIMSYGCGKYGMDTSSQIIDESPKLSIYRENGITSKGMNLPLFIENLENSQVYLVARPRLMVKSNSQCLNLNLTEFENLDMTVFTIYSTISIVSLTTTILYFGLLFLVTSLAFLFFTAGVIESLFTSIVKSWVPFSNFLLITAILICGNVIIYQNEQIVNSCISLAAQIYKNGCFVNNNINNAFHQISNGLPKSMTFDIMTLSILMWFSGIMAFFLISMFISRN